MHKLRAFLRRDSEAGTATLELAIWGVPIAMILVLFAGAIRMTSAMQTVETAAVAAARAASLENDTGSATAAAQAMAADTLALDGIDCVSMNVSVDAVGVDAPLGQVGTITANVSCTVALSDAAIIGLPGTKTMTGAAAVPYDAYKERD